MHMCRSAHPQARTFAELGIPVAVVSDAAVAAVMDRVDMALVGAEAVVESGGIVNRTGETKAWGLRCVLCVPIQSHRVCVVHESGRHVPDRHHLCRYEEASVRSS